MIATGRTPHSRLLPALGFLLLLALTCGQRVAAQESGVRFASIHAGHSITCGLTDAGSLYCWGGELGGLQVPEGWEHPMERIATSYRFRTAAINGDDLCAATPNGAAFCWTVGSRAWRRDISLNRVTSCDDCDAAALKRTLQALGHPVRGAELAPGSQLRWYLFPDFESPLPIDQVAARGAYAELHFGKQPKKAHSEFAMLGWCGRTTEGAIECWRREYESERAIAPAPLGGSTRFTAFALTEEAGCGLDAAGALYCWGDGLAGELGMPVPGMGRCTGVAFSARWSYPCSLVPVRVPTTATFSSITAGSGHLCALATDGQAWCWGNNDYGQLGRGRVGQRIPFDSVIRSHGSATPEPVAGDIRFAQLVAIAQHTCGVSVQGEIYCWGGSSIGVPPIEDAPAVCRGSMIGEDPSAQPMACTVAPRRIPATAPMRGIATSGTHTCTLDAQGGAWCWGANVAGELGDGTFEPRAAPVRVVVPAGSALAPATAQQRN